MIIDLDRSSPSRAHVRRLITRLLDDNAVVLPTETQYALACDATSRRAIGAVRAIKGRLPSAQFSIFLSGLDAFETWKIRCPGYALGLMRSFWPGPLTLVLPTTNSLFKLLGGDGKSVGVRVTPEPIINMLLVASGKPLVATSANPSGVTMNTRTENRWLRAGAKNGELVWAKPDRYIRRPASTIIDCTGKVPRELRPGPISKATWNAALSRGV